jgi:colanic acid biosynthesis glycosyl transferase WcaI
MRILYLAQYFNLPDEPGASRHYEFARAWAQAGHEVSILTGNVNYKTGRTVPCDPFRTYSVSEHPDGFQIYRLWTYSRFRGSFRKRLLFFGSFAIHASVIGSFLSRPDLVFASSTPLSIGVPGLALARRYRVPFVFELRDLWPEAVVAAGVMTDPRWIRWTRSLARFLYRRADHLIAVTRGIREGILAHDVPPERVTLIPNGVDHWMAPDRFRDRNPLERFAGRFVCLYVGAHGIWNDLETLLSAAEALRDDPRVVFVFVGDGDHKAVLERRLAQVHFLGARPKEDAFAAMVHADLGLISASGHPHNRQTLPNKIFDYMAAELPVLVAAGEGEMAELLQASNGGWVSPPEDGRALAETIRGALALDGRDRRAFGGNGRRYVLEHYFRPRLAEKLVEVFRGCVEGGAGVRPVSLPSNLPGAKDSDESYRSRVMGGEADR